MIYVILNSANANPRCYHQTQFPRQQSVWRVTSSSKVFCHPACSLRLDKMSSQFQIIYLWSSGSPKLSEVRTALAERRVFNMQYLPVRTRKTQKILKGCSIGEHYLLTRVYIISLALVKQISRFLGLLYSTRYFSVTFVLESMVFYWLGRRIHVFG